MRNTSDSLSTVANGIDWQPGENVVTFRHEFPANIYPWLRLRDAFGVEVRMCAERDGRVDLEEMENDSAALLFSELCHNPARTELVTIDKIEFQQIAPPARCEGDGGILYLTLRTIQ